MSTASDSPRAAGAARRRQTTARATKAAATAAAPASADDEVRARDRAAAAPVMGRADDVESLGRLALCVGINEFEFLPRSNWLDGCVNDATDFAEVLGEHFGFDAGDITVLTDGDATKEAVVGTLSDMVDRAVAGEVDHLVFTFSSHGTQVPDVSGDEPDRADEAFATQDIRARGDNWDPDTLITDDELSALLQELPEEVLVEVFLDTCHSGTGLRSTDLLPGRRPRFLTAPTADGEFDMGGRREVRLRDLVARGRRRSLAATPVLFAACRSGELAADAQFQGRFNGAFTYYLLQTIRSERPGSRRSVMRRVRSQLRTDRFRQTPELDALPPLKRSAIGELD
jgi:hypothetical protein